MNCRNCGDIVDPERVALGYDYCLRAECQARCLQPVTLAALGVNKAADYYTRADEVLPPRLPAPAPTEADEPSPVRPARPDARETRLRRPSTLDRLRRLDAELDDALRASADRFGRGEITAREMDRECDDLIERFNAHVRQANIRYRSMLRPRRRAIGR